MCDYSLEGLPNRLAVRGEQLVTHRFVTGQSAWRRRLILSRQTIHKAASVADSGRL
jgi:hypothetical protein